MANLTQTSSAGSLKDFAWLFVALAAFFNPATAFILAMVVLVALCILGQDEESTEARQMAGFFVAIYLK